MSFPKKPFDKGKYAESEAFRWLETRSANDSEFAWHRYPDARSARGALAAQPADSQVLVQGRHTMLEIKETAQVYRLPRTKITQYGALKRFWWAGSAVVVLVYRSVHMDWVFFTGDDLFPEAEETPASFPFKGQKTYATAALALQEIFK
jgi:hypothetical protein